MSITTQCPHCHTCYPMPENRLNNPDLKAQCKNCGNSFFPNRHLKTATPPKATAAPSTAASAAKPAAPQAVAHEQETKTLAPKIPTKKKKPKVITEGMIHDSMEIEDEAADFSISDDELNDFMARASSPLSTTPMVAASAKDTGNHTTEDEAWLDALLKNEDSPNITVMPSEPEQKQSIPLIAGEDLTTLIPKAHHQEDPQILMQKMQARLSSAPTQEQIATKRSPLSGFGWILGSVAMVALAIAQYLYFNQQAIAKNPSQSALVKKLCPPCQLPDADLRAFQISHELQKGVADFSTNLIGTLSNHATTQQLYPNLKVTVNGANGVLGELVLAPKDYLMIDKVLIGAKSDERFMLTLDAPREDIASVKIEPFY